MLTTKVLAGITGAGNDPLARFVGSLFSDMKLADEEIAAAQARCHPEHAEALWDTFVSLRRPRVLRAKAGKLYRAHCRELLERVVTGDTIDFATRAEVVAVLSEATLKTRLRSPAEHLYLRLYVELGFPLRGTTLDSLEGQLDWDVDSQNAVFSQIARRLNTKRARRCARMSKSSDE